MAEILYQLAGHICRTFGEHKGRIAFKYFREPLEVFFGSFHSLGQQGILDYLQAYAGVEAGAAEFFRCSSVQIGNVCKIDDVVCRQLLLEGCDNL